MTTTAQDIASKYPIPTYRYSVSIGNEKMAFSGVSGLEIAFQTLEYKDGLGGWFQMPGKREPLNISLKRGLVPGKSELYDWISSISLNQVDKKDISISLTNEAGTEALVTWNVTDAFPTKLTAPSLDASSNEIAIEELSLMAKYMSIQFR